MAVKAKGTCGWHELAERAAGGVIGMREARSSKRAVEEQPHLALAVDVGRHDTQNVREGISFKNERHAETGRCGVCCN